MNIAIVQYNAGNIQSVLYALERLGVQQLAVVPGEFTAGGGDRTFKLDGLPPFLGLVCYEIIFPDEIGNAGDAGDARPRFLLNVTNDGWYGRTPGPHQHLRQAEVTAVMLGLPLIRSANTGISLNQR